MYTCTPTRARCGARDVRRARPLRVASLLSCSSSTRENPTIRGDPARSPPRRRSIRWSESSCVPTLHAGWRARAPGARSCTIIGVHSVAPPFTPLLVAPSIARRASPTLEPRISCGRSVAERAPFCGVCSRDGAQTGASARGETCAAVAKSRAPVCVDVRASGGRQRGLPTRLTVLPSATEESERASLTHRPRFKSLFLALEGRARALSNTQADQLEGARSTLTTRPPFTRPTVLPSSATHRESARARPSIATRAGEDPRLAAAQRGRRPALTIDGAGLQDR